MTCAERRDLLLLYAAGALEPAEREELRAHLDAGCPVCAGALAEAEAIVAQAGAAVTPVAPPPAALDKLMARVGTSPSTARAGIASDGSLGGVGDTPPTDPPASQRGRDTAHGTREGDRRLWLAPLLAAAAAVAVTSGVFLYVTRDARSIWRSSDLATVTLASQTQPSARGQVWWDREHGQWRVQVAKLATPAAGREYELWVIPKGGKPIRSKSFGLDAGGGASIVVPVPPGVGPSAVAAITDEPLGGLDAPTGKVHLAGTFE